MLHWVARLEQTEVQEGDHCDSDSDSCSFWLTAAEVPYITMAATIELCFLLQPGQIIHCSDKARIPGSMRQESVICWRSRNNCMPLLLPTDNLFKILLTKFNKGPPKPISAHYSRPVRRQMRIINESLCLYSWLIKSSSPGKILEKSPNWDHTSKPMAKVFKDTHKGVLGFY